MVYRIFVLMMFLFVLGCGPILVMPGGGLDRTTSTVPTDWRWTDDVSTIQLETRPDDPYSVNLWIIALGDSLLVHAGTNRAAWVEHIEANASVRVQVEEKIFELVATRVSEQSEFDAFSDAYEKKYSVRPRHEDVREAYLYRLRAR
ncbi:MAG: hypothetical protein VCB25_00765 [Myxococcota bacterium]